MKKLNSIITFYSYKGGVGRSMALANIGVLLAQRGVSVLMIDWDLEAPGLEKYFKDFKILDSEKGGLLDFLITQKENNNVEKYSNYSDYCSTIKTAFDGKLSIMTSGSKDENYIKNLQSFDWKEFFKKSNGSLFIETFRRKMLEDYNYILIDSRTGLTDSGGVCTIQLPDIIIPVFTANEQSLYGVKDIVKRAQNGRQKLPYDRAPLAILPILSRFDTRTEYNESQKWLDLVSKEMSSFLDDWRPKNIKVNKIIERVKIPYVAFFSFGEKLPVLSGSITDPESMGYSYDFISKLIVNQFDQVEELLSPKGISDLDVDNKYQAEYLRTRVDDQISWHTRKALRNKRIFQLTYTGIILCLVVLLVLLGFITESNMFNLVGIIGLLAVLAIILFGLNSVYDYRGNWLKYNRTLELMEREKLQFLTKTGDYEKANFQEFVKNFEDILTVENAHWRNEISNRSSKHK